MDEQQKKKEESQRVSKIKKMLLESPDDCFLLHALGLEYIKGGDLGQAINSFNKVLTVDENYVGTYYHLAHALWSAQDKGAADVFKKGMEVARTLKDHHSLSELSAAYDEYQEELDEY